MKKFGFTLAEVLITLGIIGVVAALTTPSLVQNSRNEANGAKLAVVVSNLENAFTSAITTEAVDTIFQTRIWQTIPAGVMLDGVNGTEAQKAAFVGELSRYLAATGFRNESVMQYYARSNATVRKMNVNGGQGDPAGAVDFGNGSQAFPVLMKNGAVVFFRATSAGRWSVNEDQARNAGSAFYEEAADIFIDVNGTSAPNIIGRDIFTFYLGQNGILYPAGGVDVSIFDNNYNRNQIWSNQGSEWSCIPGSIRNAGWGCTARLVEENYRMNY